MKAFDGSASSSTSLLRSASKWWRDIALREGRVAATRQLGSGLWDFIRDSTRERRRQRYGDIEFDWQHHVDTTSAAVGWRERLLGVFHSAYQPTETALFHEMLTSLREQTRIEFHNFVFIDLGSGKGRALLMASDYPFRRIVGVELLPALHRAALDNLGKYRSQSQKCFALESICADATEFVFPGEPTVLYLFHPFPETGLKSVIANLRQSLSEKPRAVYVLYHNPLLEHVLGESAALKKVFETHQYAVYGSRDIQIKKIRIQSRKVLIRNHLWRTDSARSSQNIPSKELTGKIFAFGLAAFICQRADVFRALDTRRFGKSRTALGYLSVTNEH